MASPAVSPDARSSACSVLHPRPVRRAPDRARQTSSCRSTGRTFAEPRRRGKYLWLPFTDGDAILAHLGMSGQFRLADADAPLAPEHQNHLRFRRR